MIGHQSLLQNRLNGSGPSDVMVHVLDSAPIYGPFTHPENCIDLTRSGEIHINPADNIDALDLRCVAGLPVQIIGSDADRVRKAVKRLAHFTPSRIIASGFKPGLIVRWEPTSGYEKLEF